MKDVVGVSGITSAVRGRGSADSQVPAHHRLPDGVLRAKTTKNHGRPLFLSTLRNILPRSEGRTTKKSVWTVDDEVFYTAAHHTHTHTHRDADVDTRPLRRRRPDTDHHFLSHTKTSIHRLFYRIRRIGRGTGGNERTFAAPQTQSQSRDAIVAND